ncbi:MAG: DMT family transporter [Burkholderiales bacterium]
MKGRDVADLLLLGALWGASFLFMRVAVPQFGPLPLMAVRCGVGAAVLLPLLAWRGQLEALRPNAGRLLTVGVLNSALPFALFAYATLSLTAGFTALLNSTVPIWGALVAYAWLGDVPSRRQRAGLAIGFAGVLLLVRDRISFGASGDSLAVIASLVATLSYGVSASYTRRRLADVPALLSATGSQVGATLALAVPAALTWPADPPAAGAWGAAIALGVGCTGLAYILYFRLIARVGPARAISVTYLVPVFAIVWGSAFLGETPTLAMLGAGAVILLGTALATGLLDRRAPSQAA